MAFLAKGKKEDLRCLAIELGESVPSEIKVIELKNLVTKSVSYEEEFVKGMLDTIINSRLEKEKKEQMEFELKKEKEQMEFELKKLEIESRGQSTSDQMPSDSGQHYFELIKLMPRFKSREDDIVIYLSLFERQAKRAKINAKDWVSCLLALLPSEIVQLIARESEETFEDYSYVKTILLRRFKLSAESFRKKFVQHQRSAEKSWKDFAFEMTNYFQEWITGLEVKDFDGLKNLMITDQIKRRVPPEVRDHFLDDWTKLKSPTELANKLDEYESVRDNRRKSVTMKEKPLEKYPSQTNPTEQPFKDKFSGNRNGGNRTYYQSPKYTPRQPHKLSCYLCGLEGHFAKFCPKNAGKKNSSVTAQSNIVQVPTEEEVKPNVLSAKISAPISQPANLQNNVEELKTVSIKCGSRILEGIIDSGAQISVVREDLVVDTDFEGEGKIEIASAFGEKETTPLRVFKMKLDDRLHGTVPITCAVSKKLVNDLLLSMNAYEALLDNIQIHSSGDSFQIDPNVVKVKNFEPPESSSLIIGSVTKDDATKDRANKSDFVKLQHDDIELKDLWDLAKNEKNSYRIYNDLLVHVEKMFGENVKQIVLPVCKRKEVLKMAHEIPLAGHLGELKTKQRIKYSFFWPSIKTDVKNFCDSCKICQLRKPVTYRDRIPIQPITRPEVPFEVWSIDCIGPLEPPSRRGHKYIVCAIDLCSRWADAIPVKEISAKTTCNVLMKIFVQTGFPAMICTDQGTNFTSKLTKAFLDVVGVSPRFATPGHPESMGAVERWNRTLKNMLNKNIQEHGREWDVHLPYLLFAYREVPHTTTGLSPYQLVYGRIPRGPLSLLKNSWTGEETIPTSASQSVETYLQDLMQKLKNAHDIASENAKVAQDCYATRYNLRSRVKKFNVGDQVLVLIPSSPNKLLNTWKGPATVIEMTRQHSAKVEMEDGSIRELHINKLRPYIQRINHIGMVFELDEDFGTLHYAPADKTKKSVEDIRKHLKSMESPLTERQKQELFDILQHYGDVFSSKPGHAKVKGHSIKVTENCCPKRLKPYRVPITLQKEVDRQVKELLDMGLIEPSDSEWAHPVVCVAKKNGSVRLCIDFRLLNSFTVPDAYPMKIAKDLLFEVGQAKFITVLDLTKGYWQIPMEKEAKPFTAFVTHSGHYQWNVLPFGMKNAGSTFQKSIDKALELHKAYCRSYIDDLAIFSKTWLEHCVHIQRVFKTLREVGLTVNLEKCEFGKNQVRFLGHLIGSGQHSPDPEKVEVIKSLAKPTTKKEVRSLLGLASYYRDYIPQFSEIVLPLTNLTKKSVPNNIPWNADTDESFNKLKEELIKMPSLHTPDLHKPFQLYTDASATAIGACLAQNDEHGKELPIAFFSKKLNACQIKWSTIEREAFCVLEALKKFDTWVFGAEIQIISDHNPLTYLTQSTPHGAKLSRWSLALQRYNLTITYRKGSRHGNADALSRLKFDTPN
jgi:hypothetical protein